MRISVACVDGLVIRRAYAQYVRSLRESRKACAAGGVMDTCMLVQDGLCSVQATAEAAASLARHKRQPRGTAE